MKRFVYVICLLFFCGCSHLPNGELPQIASTPLIQSSESLATFESSQTVTYSSTVTATTSPSNTPTPTSTPRPTIPVSLETPVPAVSELISPFNADQLKLLAKYERYDPGKTLVKLTQDNRFYYVASREGIDVYDAQSRQLLRHHDIHLQMVDDRYDPNDLEISRDNNRFKARVSGSKVVVYNADGFEIYAYEFPAALHGSGDAALSPNGKYLALDICSECNAYTGQPGFKIVDIDTGNTIYENGITPDGEAHGSTPVFSPDGKILATYLGGVVVLWDTATWKRLTDFSLGSPFIGDRIDFSGDSSIAAILGDSVVYVWRLEDRQRLRVFEVCGSGRNIPQAVFSPDNEAVAVLNCNRVDVWKIDDGTLLSEQKAQYSSLTGIQLDNDGNLTAYAPVPKNGVTYAPWNSWYTNGDFRFTGNPPAIDFVSSGYPGNACSISLQGNARCAQGSFILSQEGDFYQLVTDKNTAILRPGLVDYSEPILSFTWSGLYLDPLGLDLKHNLFFYEIWSTPHSSIVYLMDTTTVKNIAQYPGGISENRIHYSPDGNLAIFHFSLNPGERFIIYDLVNRKTVFQDSSRWNSSSGMAFTPDGKYLAYFMVKPGEQYDFYNVIEVNLWANLTKHTYEPVENESPTVIQYSPDGAMLAMGFSNGDMRLFDVGEDRLVYKWKANMDRITGLAFSSDMAYLASASADGDVLIWGIWK